MSTEQGWGSVSRGAEDCAAAGNLWSVGGRWFKPYQGTIINYINYVVVGGLIVQPANWYGFLT